MDKVIKKCGVCGTKVACHDSDADPVCAGCLEWFLNMEVAHKIELAANNLVQSIASTQRVSDSLRSVNKSMLSHKQIDAANQLIHLDLIASKASMYMSILKGVSL